MVFKGLVSLALLTGSLVPVLGWGAGEAALPRAATEIRLEVTLGDRQLRVMRGDELVQSYPVAIGQEQYPTPTGDFNISRVIWNPRWVPPESEWARDESPKEPGDPGNPMGKVKIFFSEPDYYIHGTEAEESLGRAASHGCVRMANADVVELGRLVMENGGEARSLGWFRRIVNFVRSTEEVRLSEPVPLTITG
jgi:lipoprotein-anchoring transpeptidase ErfK/SrfK